MPRLRLAFMGSALFSLPILAGLLDAGHQVVAVYSQPPRPAGRGRRTRPSPVDAFAADRGLRVLTPATLKGEAALREFAALAAAAAVVAAYGLILPKAFLEAPRLGCLNVHASLLPRWRGAAPIERAILEGDAETGVTIMRIDEGVDSGPILAAAKVGIGPETTAAGLAADLAALGARLILEVLEGLAAGRLAPTPQPAVGITYAPKLRAAEGRLDWRRSAAELERAVRALNPSPGTWFEHQGERIKVLAAEVGESAEAPPGTVVDGRLTVACGAGALRLTRVQRAGRAAATGEAFLRGYRLPAGTRLE